jgi:hypothetical protein
MKSKKEEIIDSILDKMSEGLDKKEAIEKTKEEVAAARKKVTSAIEGEKVEPLSKVKIEAEDCLDSIISEMSEGGVINVTTIEKDKKKEDKPAEVKNTKAKKDLFKDTQMEEVESTRDVYLSGSVDEIDVELSKAEKFYHYWFNDVLKRAAKEYPSLNECDIVAFSKVMDIRDELSANHHHNLDSGSFDYALFGFLRIKILQSQRKYELNKAKEEAASKKPDPEQLAAAERIAKLNLPTL